MLGVVNEPPKYIQFVAGGFSGCRLYRCSLPAYHLNWLEGIGFHCLETPVPILDHSVLCQTRTIVLKSPGGKGGLETVKQLCAIRAKYGIRLVADYDDYVADMANPDEVGFNPFAGKPRSEEDIEAEKEMLPLFDCIMVTTEYFKRRMEAMYGLENVLVVPNAVSRTQWSKPRRKPLTEDLKKPVILSSGCPLHSQNSHVNEKGEQVPFQPGDWAASEWIDWIVEGVSNDRFDFIALGGPYEQWTPIQNRIQQYPWVSPFQFASFVSRIEADFVIAPLLESDFSRCKSPLRFLEASVCSSVFIGNTFPDSPYLISHPDSQVPVGSSKKQLQERLDMLCQKDKYNEVVEWQWNKLVSRGHMLETDRHTNLLVYALTGGPNNQIGFQYL